MLTTVFPDFDRDQWGRPIITGQQYHRPSKIARALSDSNGLLVWSAQMALAGAAKQRDILDGNITRNVAESAMALGGANKARDFGSEIHESVHNYIRGTYDVPHADLAAHIVHSILQRYRIEGTEIPIVNHHRRTAGTCDLVLSDGGIPIIADVKTGADDWQATSRSMRDMKVREWSIQLGLYATGNPWLDGQETQWNDYNLQMPSQHHGLIIHVLREPPHTIKFLRVAISPAHISTAIEAVEMARMPIPVTDIDLLPESVKL